MNDKEFLFKKKEAYGHVLLSGCAYPSEQLTQKCVSVQLGET